jgi:2,4-dienoyl-CoA reductase-like NADH-dependent reductase (Old Yellow Enzyme family)
MEQLFSPVAFTHGPAMRNRFMLAPLTTTQNLDDGTASEDEFRWLTAAARGGFGLTLTGVANVQEQGQGFPGQLGIFSDAHMAGLSRLAEAIKAADSLALVQLHHAGRRSPTALIGTAPVGPSDDAESGTRALSTAEVEAVVEDFVTAAGRAQRAGFDGIEVHGAHGYLVAQFLSAEMNRRTDRYGGPLENRARLLFDIVAGIRGHCGAGFIVAVRLSPERFGMRLAEMRTVAQRLLREGQIDLLDMSLWDVFKEPQEEEFQGRSLLSCFTELDRGAVPLAVAGKIQSGRDAVRCLEAGADVIVVGRAAILHPDFPQRVAEDPEFEAVAPPVTADYLRRNGLGEAFIGFLRDRWDFVQE